MSDVLVWVAISLPVSVAAVLTGRLLLLRRQEAELGWELAAQKESRAVETEQRIRSEHAAELSRTIHDDLGHRLTLASIEAAALRTRAGTDLAPDLERLRASIAECVEALNRSVSGLSLEAKGSGLEESIEHIADTVRQTETPVQVDIQVARNLAGSTPSSTTTSTAISVVREGCTNALRHAPGAPIRIRIQSDRGEVVIGVENDAADTAVGPTIAPTGGRGLRGLRTQVEELGGSLKTGPSGDGWHIRASLPLQATTGVNEARHALAHRRRRTRRMLIALPVATAALMIAIPVGMVLGQAALSRLSATDFAAITVGESESSARSRLPIVEMEAPPQQVGSGDCRHYESTFSPFERTEVYEVCFTNGQVNSTTIIPAP